MKKQIKSVVVMTFLCACTQSVHAESPLLKQGIEDYNAGDYANAVGHLGQSLSQEFGNPVMHYYMGNAYVHLRERDAAIREFRIAFALDPKSRVGELAKKALSYMKVDDETSSKPKLPEKSKIALPPPPPVDRTMDRTVSTVFDQAEKIKNQHTREGQARSNDIGRYGHTAYQKTKSEIDDNLTYYRRGRAYKLPMPNDASSLLERLQKMYGDQQATSINEGLKRAEDIQHSAENLNSLLHDQKHGNGPKLLPAGTNLYVRNYQAPAKAEQKPVATPQATPPKVELPKVEPRVEQTVEGKVEQH